MKKMLFLILMLFLLIACEKEQVTPLENEDTQTTTVEFRNDDPISDLITYVVEELDLPFGPEKSILVQLRNIQRKLDQGQTEEALAMLEDLIAHIEEMVADGTIADTEDLQDFLDDTEWVRCDLDPDCENLLSVVVNAPGETYTLYVHPDDQRTGSPQSNGVPWGDYSPTNAFSHWDGKTNTDKILATVPATFNDGNFAAKICDDLNGDGPKVWYLPAKEELTAIYNKFGDTQEKRDHYGFNGWFYWSSSEYSAFNAWSQVFGHGSQLILSKPSGYGSCRCVRR